MGEWAGETVGPDVWETCRELSPAGSVFAFLAEHRGALFPARMFADMYPSANGRPSMPPQILAAAITLQALHGLSDFETVQELRCDLRWKAACGLGVLPCEVGGAAGGWLALQCGVSVVVIVGVQPCGEGVVSFLLGVVGAGVGPFVEQGAVEAFDFAVGLGPVGPGSLVGDPGCGEQVTPVA
jgi:hypothetical protein